MAAQAASFPPSRDFSIVQNVSNFQTRHIKISIINAALTFADYHAEQGFARFPSYRVKSFTRLPLQSGTSRSSLNQYWYAFVVANVGFLKEMSGMFTLIKKPPKFFCCVAFVYVIHPVVYSWHSHGNNRT